MMLPEVVLMREAPVVALAEGQRIVLRRWSRGRSTAVRLMQRARMILMADEGMTNKAIAKAVGMDSHTVARWRGRFVEKGLSGLKKDAPRSGRRPTRRDSVAGKIIERTTRTAPTNATHWSVRTLAKELGVSASMVHRVWKANGLKPHLTRTFKLSNDPHFVEKLQDVVGLYLNPPEHAMVLSVDEKSQIQALDRTQQSFPMIPGRCGTMTHDYKRHGTTTLLAALELAEGTLIGTCMARHRHQEWIEFLKRIDANTPPELDLHLIADNYSTHKHPKVQKWLQRHARFHMHFIPTSSSWLNLIERWFRDLTDKCIRRGAFRSVEHLTQVIMGYIDAHNENPKALVWTAKMDDILAKVSRASAVLANVASE
jgi:transposase